MTDIVIWSVFCALLARCVWVLTHKRLRDKALRPWSRGDVIGAACIIAGISLVRDSSLGGIIASAGGVLMANLLINSR